ncbi:hypothetical protein EKO27_g5529 [Xylaria grammica]|uniref:Infection structure specific protein n=1 Tax=Xylaria grammica TaxID=363999 RepID=A0A439D5A0_9PEZI|nr:hypothetical protein F5X98DRAFT_269595 [Xylaria grammica]RWA09589.1 hypothetical protein EKO27_g5529 [Xylaria grammica]GAW19769.1 hypothetical protein ANO14919_092590 [Xylariales sp. No.14919]
MYNTKVLLSVAALTGASMAQTSTVFPDPACSSSIFALVAAAPTTPPELESAFSAVASGAGTESLDLLVRPSAYVDQLCSYVSELPESILPVFASWGADLLNFASTEIDSYDGIVTKCVTTGTAASSITSFIHSIASNPAELCKESSSTPSNGTASITSYPTPTGNGTTPSASSSTLIPTGAAARPTGVLAGAAAVGGVLGVVALL